VSGKKQIVFLNELLLEFDDPRALNLKSLSVGKVEVHCKMIELAIFYNINLLAFDSSWPILYAQNFFLKIINNVISNVLFYLGYYKVFNNIY
jgi:hypothetical protein